MQSPLKSRLMQSDGENRILAGPGSFRPYIPAVVVCICALILTVGGFLIVRSNYQKAAQAEFDQAAQERVAAIHRSFREKLLILSHLHSMYSLFSRTPGPEFRAFVRPFESELAGLRALQWVTRVTDKDRSRFVQHMRSQGFTGYEITERGKQGKMVRAARRAEYYPILPIDRHDANELATGFDLASEPIRRQALERARDTGEITASARVRLLEERQPGIYGFLMFAPIYNSGPPPQTVQARRERIRGFIIAVFRFRDAIESALEVLEPREMDITLRDLSAPAGSQLLYTHSPRSATGSAVPPLGFGFKPAAYTRTIKVGGRTWSITSTPAVDFISESEQSIEWLVLIAGLAFSILLTVYLVVTTRHTEEMILAKNALVEARNELELRVEERTRDLQQAQEELVKRSRLATLGQLTATVSHELRNPLGTALTSLDFIRQQLQDRLTDSGIEAAVERLARSIQRCDRIIDELLDYTRLRTRSLNVIELDEFLMEYLHEHQIPSDVTLTRTLNAAGVKVAIDADLFSRALINIIDNACQAMHENTGTRELHLFTERTNGHCRVIVRDNGPGMQQETRDKLFEPLYSTKTYGVGLGMAIVKQIMEQLGGRVSVQSEPRRGTAVSLWLPVINQAAGD